MTVLPSLLTPSSPTISVLREAAVRLQAEILLVFRINSDLHVDYAIWGKDKVKAYSTCEAVLLDVKTGLIPFTSVVTREYLTKSGGDGLDTYETTQRAKKTAALESLEEISDRLVDFLDSLP